MEPEIACPLKQNHIITGATGAGKSSYINRRVGRKVAEEGNSITSCTSTITSYEDNPETGPRLFDVPGFNDNKIGREKIFVLLQQFAQEFLKDTNNTKQIDVNILVVKCSPRAQTLVTDLEQLAEIFGEKIFSTTIILLVFTDDAKGLPLEDEVLQELESMDYLKETFGAHKKTDLRDWFVIWSNKYPKANQEEELKRKIQLLDPYSHSSWIKARAEHAERLNKKYAQDITQMKAEFKQRAGEHTDEEVQSYKKKLELMEQEFEAKLKLAILLTAAVMKDHYEGQAAATQKSPEVKETSGGCLIF